MWELLRESPTERVLVPRRVRSMARSRVTSYWEKGNVLRARVEYMLGERDALRD